MQLINLVHTAYLVSLLLLSTIREATSVTFDQEIDVKNRDTKGLKVNVQRTNENWNNGRNSKRDVIGKCDAHQFKFNNMNEDTKNCDSGGTNCDEIHRYRYFEIAIKKRQADGEWPSGWDEICYIQVAYKTRKNIVDRWVEYESCSISNKFDMSYKKTEGFSQELTLIIGDVGSCSNRRLRGAPSNSTEFA